MNGNAAVYVAMFEAARLELRNDFDRFAQHLFDHFARDRRQIEWTAAQDDHMLLSVKCQVSEFQHDIKGPAADNDYIDAGEEFLEPVRLLLTGVQEVKRVVRASQKAIDAHSTKNREFDGEPPDFTLV